MRIGIVGGGFVGSATRLLKCDMIEAITYDLDPARCNPASTKKEDLLSCDLVFVCVPTPAFDSGRCNTRIVDKCIEDLKSIGVKNIVLRSTVPPGTSRRLDTMFMPEFLTEANWAQDFYECGTWVFGVRTFEEGTLVRSLIEKAHTCGVIKSKEVMLVGTEEAEMIKYTRNNFLATKIAFFNEIAEICKAVGADYNAVRQGVIADSRIGASHTVVPGPDGHKGFGGTCLPKDTNALVYFAKEAGVDSYVVRAAVERNSRVDRPERDWESDPRAYTKS
jgi:UDPglucose 6-dehydrogenase